MRKVRKEIQEHRDLVVLMVVTEIKDKKVRQDLVDLVEIKVKKVK